MRIAAAMCLVSCASMPWPEGGAVFQAPDWYAGALTGAVPYDGGHCDPRRLAERYTWIEVPSTEALRDTCNIDTAIACHSTAFKAIYMRARDRGPFSHACEWSVVRHELLHAWLACTNDHADSGHKHPLWLVLNPKEPHVAKGCKE